MIFIRLSGGLGNQLYQLAAASLLAQELKCPVMPFADALQRYSAPRDPDSFKLLQWNDWLKKPIPEAHALCHWLSVSGRVGRFVPLFGISDRNFFGFKRRLSGLPRFLDGYFQHGWTAETFAEALSAMPVAAVGASTQSRLEPNETVIHIRGGDFLKLPRFQVVHAAFYATAVRQALATGRQQFAVITDDPSYASQVCNEVSRDVPQATFRILGRGANALEDFDTLRCASGRIIGNSTFAWWAAALGGSGRPTWGPTKLAIDEPRDFYLPDEIPIESLGT